MLGLDDRQVEESRQRAGCNVLTPPRRVPWWRLYADKYRDPVIRILLAAALLSLLLAFVGGSMIEPLGIILAVFIATTIGFYFEHDAARRFSVLTALEEERPVKVRRNGGMTEVARREVVVGDVVVLEPGDEVPADGQLVVADGLCVDESSLTGEPMARKCAVHAGAVSSPSSPYRADQVLRSSMVMEGRGIMRVVAVGDQTEIGRVARAASSPLTAKTPLGLQLERLARLISKVGTGIAVAAFTVFLIHDILVAPDIWQQGDWLAVSQVVLRYFMMAVTLIVMAVPEGLPMAVTLALALNMRRMLRSDILVRRLHACETMGAVTVVCTDKTGTLTQNRMAVQQVYEPYGRSPLLHVSVALNTTAVIGTDGQGIGNPTEVALLRWLPVGEAVRLRQACEVVARLPFTTELKYMATIARVDGRTWLFVKGAPEKFVPWCQMSGTSLDEYQSVLGQFQHRAMRTLALACRELTEPIDKDPDWAMLLSDLQLQAVVAISDPVRPDVAAALADCQRAGIAVKMVTGDTETTALEIARRVGVVAPTDSSPVTVTGEAFSLLRDTEAQACAVSLQVMSRARPADKQRLVEMLQRHGEVVAVTGDGTNDAPALHQAQVGLSLGSGTGVAQEASDITLLDDSFTSVAHAVMWGRSLYQNIQRFLFFQLVVNATALLLVLGGAFVGTELPLTITQMLWVNLIMDTFAALSLASLPPSHDVMNDRPRRSSDFMVTRSMAGGIGACSLLFFAVMFAFLIWCERDEEVSVRELTLFFTTFVGLQFWNLFNAKAWATGRSAFHRLHRDRGMLLVLVLILAGQWLIVTFGGTMFRTVPLSMADWMAIMSLTSLVLWVGEIRRLWIRKKR